MKLFNFENLKNSSIYVTPNLPIITTHRYKFSLLRLIGYLSLYTLAAWLVLIFIFAITPIKDYLFVVDNSELKTQTEKIKELQNRVIILSDQLQELASTNERMKYAMKLTRKDSIKSNDPLYDTLQKKIEKKINIGGDLYSAFKDLFEKIIQEVKSTNQFIFVEPTSGIITQEFNPAKGHMGIDYGERSGSPVYASAGGLITFADYTVDSGFMIIVQHDNDYITIYKHCSAITKKVRDRVSQGELIALSGNSGKNTTGSHLHFEIWQNGKPIDPQKFLSK
jgi:murein DD-endopeptidase MepM/ murein hydrolase activator NlpD